MFKIFSTDIFLVSIKWGIQRVILRPSPIQDARFLEVKRVEFTEYNLACRPACVVGKGKGHPRTGHEGLEGELMYSSTLSLSSVLDGGGRSMPRSGRLSPWKDAVPIVQEAGWPAGQAENLTCTGNRSPDRPARSESLYRLSYPGAWCVVVFI